MPENGYLCVSSPELCPVRPCRALPMLTGASNTVAKVNKHQEQQQQAAIASNSRAAAGSSSPAATSAVAAASAHYNLIQAVSPFRAELQGLLWQLVGMPPGSELFKALHKLARALQDVLPTGVDCELPVVSVCVGGGGHIWKPQTCFCLSSRFRNPCRPCHFLP